MTKDYENYIKAENLNGRSRLSELGIEISAAKMEELVLGMKKQCVKFCVTEPSNPQDDSYRYTHFGDVPYFEYGEAWPCDKKGRPLNFILQIFGDSQTCMPEDVKLIQFFLSNYEDDDVAYTQEDNKWLFIVRKNIDFNKAVKPQAPTGLEVYPYCEINYEKKSSFPDGLESYTEHPAYILENVINVSNELIKRGEMDGESLEESCRNFNYDDLIAKLLGAEARSENQIGGYPQWLQSANPPPEDGYEFLLCINGLNIEVSAKIDLPFELDQGAIYLFYRPLDNKICYLAQYT